MKGPPSEKNKPRVALQMTDEDVVAEYASFFGCGYRSWQPTQMPSGVVCKKVYACIIKGSKALSLMRRLQPHMSQRRQAQIQAALDSYNPNFRQESCAARRTLDSGALGELKASLLSGVSIRSQATRFSVHHETIRTLIDWSDVPIPPKVQRTLAALPPSSERKRLASRTF